MLLEYLFLKETRKGRGRRGKKMMQPDRDERDAEIEALRRQVEEFTVRLERQETHGTRSSSYNYASGVLIEPWVICYKSKTMGSHATSC